jgi:hypothetical protein
MSVSANSSEHWSPYRYMLFSTHFGFIVYYNEAKIEYQSHFMSLNLYAFLRVAGNHIQEDMQRYHNASRHESINLRTAHSILNSQGPSPFPLRLSLPAPHRPSLFPFPPRTELSQRHHRPCLFLCLVPSLFL